MSWPRDGSPTPLLFSILMPCRNAVTYLRPTLETVARQGGSDWELIVQDAMSSDGSQEILLGFAESSVYQVSLVSEADEGQADALNRALQRARGRYIIWLNADDLLADGALDSIRRVLARDTSVDVVYGDWSIVDRAGRTVRYNVVHEWSRDRFFRCGNYIFSGAVIVRTDVVRELGAWNSRLHYCMDFDFCLRLPTDVKAIHSGSHLAALRWHESAKSSVAGWQFLREAWTVRRWHGHGVRELLTAMRAVCVMGVSTVTHRLRYGRLYSTVRPTKGHSRHSERKRDLV